MDEQKGGKQTGLKIFKVDEQKGSKQTDPLTNTFMYRLSLDSSLPDFLFYLNWNASDITQSIPKEKSHLHVLWRWQHKKDRDGEARRSKDKAGMESSKGPGGPGPPPWFWLDNSKCLVGPSHFWPGALTVQRTAVSTKPILCTKWPNFTMLFYYVKMPGSSSP